MDTLDQIAANRVQKPKNRRRTISERREIVEQTLLAGASVSRVARQNDVNANQVFYWRKRYREGQLEIGMGTQLLPVKITPNQTAPITKPSGVISGAGSLEIQLSKGIVRVAGNVDVAILRAAIECLVQ